MHPLLCARFELAMLFPGAFLSTPNLHPPPYAVVFACVNPLSLVLAPLLFNPRCFALSSACKDVPAWLKWLASADPTGWTGRYQAHAETRRGISLHALALPSKELFIGSTALLICYEAMRTPYAQ